MKFPLFTLVLLLMFSNAYGNCISEARVDLLAMLIQKYCPETVQELKKALAKEGLKTLPAMVANRGAHNPQLGSFSIFESTQGYSKSLKRNVLPEHLYFGHFTAVTDDQEIILDQENESNKLLIEVIAFDFEKEVYNFYELIGTVKGPRWFYRGNSFDAFEDNKALKLMDPPQFGTRMRCSACHNSGGPIMKELTLPHNDWWKSKKGLSFGSNKPSPELQEYLSTFIDASEFASNVKRGISLLDEKKIILKRSLKEKLRPLFCSTEINLVSSKDSWQSLKAEIQIPSAIFINPMLVENYQLLMKKDFYTKALSELGFQFPETDLPDADHAFLAPVKGESNQRQIQLLIQEGLIDEEFAIDVLSVDFTNPLFSEARCKLLRLIKDAPDWKNNFRKDLLLQDTRSAQKLAKDLEIENRKDHRVVAQSYLSDKEETWKAPVAVKDELIKLNLLRLSVGKDDLSKNPKGQILEPGFRVVFPTPP